MGKEVDIKKQYYTYMLEHASVGLACSFLCVFTSFVAEGANVESYTANQEIRREIQERALSPFAGDREVSALGHEELQGTNQARKVSNLESIEKRPPVYHIDLKARLQISLQESTKSMVAFRIRALHIDTSEPRFLDYESILSAYENKRLSAEDIKAIRTLLEEKIRRDGFITTFVSVPEQDLMTGTLIVRVEPGYLGRIRYPKGTVGRATMAMPYRVGSILNLRDIEQGLEQMRRIYPHGIGMKIIPSDKAGYSDVELVVQPDKGIDLSLSIDDGGYRSTGKLQSTLRGRIKQPLGIYDEFIYTYTKDVAHHDEQFGSSSYSTTYRIPYGKYTVTAGISKFTYHQTIAGIYPYRLGGVTKQRYLSLERMVHRDEKSVTSLVLKGTRKSRKSSINHEDIQVQGQETSTLEIGANHRIYNGRVSANYYGFLRKGIGAWGAKQHPWEGEAQNPTSRFTLWGVQGEVRVPFSDTPLGTGTYIFRFVGQYTKDRLYTVDQLSIGGRYSVRGFSGEYTLSAESGYYMTHEVEIGQGTNRLRPYVGIDYGYVNGPSSEYLIGKHLAGLAVGIRSQIGTSVTADLFVSWPLYAPEGFKKEGRVYGFSSSVQW